MRNGTLVDNIKAAYIYYPLSYDPSDYTDGELLLFNEASDAIAAGTFLESDYTAEELALINGVKLSGGTVEKVVRFGAEFPGVNIENFYSDSHSDDPMARIARQSFMVDGETLPEWEF